MQETLTTNDTVKLIKQARKSFVFTDRNIWMKKDENFSFDITMGSHEPHQGLRGC